MARDKKKKPQRPKALPPKGFRDYFGAEVAERNAMLAQIAEVYHRYGFDALESSAVETVEALGSFLPDVERPNAGVFAWQDEDDAWMALRYDLTAPLARVYAQHRNELPTPYRRYAMGPVWRNEKPGPGRYRQFYQCDADTVGAASVAADAEICAMLSDTLEAVGIDKDDYIIKLNNRKILNGVMEVAGILDASDPNMFAIERGIVLRAIDKLDRLGADGVRALLGTGRKDDSGAYTDGACLEDQQIDIVMGFVEANEIVEQELRDVRSSMVGKSEGAKDLTKAIDSRFADLRALIGADIKGSEIRNEFTIKHLRNLVSNSDIGLVGVDELEEITNLLKAQGYEADRIVIDPSVVRGLGYYTGPVYEAELTFEILDAKGRKRQFGSVAGGGRYDDLVKRFTGQEVPATGVSIGVDRLLAALREKGRISSQSKGPVVVTVMDRDRMGDYQEMVAELRNAGIRAEVYLGNPKNFGNQLKYADKRESPVAVIEGGNEKEAGVVQIKDLALGARLSAEIETAEEWKAQPAQIEIKRGDLVAEVRKMIARAEAMS